MFILWVIAFLTLALSLSIEWKKWRINKKLRGWIAQHDVPVIGIGSLFIGKSAAEADHIIDHLLLEPYTTKMPARFWIGPELFIGISDPDDLQAVFNATECINKPDNYSALNCNYGLGLSHKVQWKNDRRALNPTLNNAMLFVRLFLPKINKIATGFCVELNKTSDTESDFKYMLIRTLVSQVIATLFDMDYEVSLQEATEAYDSIVRIEHLTKRRIHRFWLRWDFIYRLTAAYKEQTKVENGYRKFLRKLEEHKRNSMREVSEKKEDVLEEAKENVSQTFVEKLLLLSGEKKMSDEVVNDHLFLIFIAGIMTTSCSILTTLLVLAVFPEYQEKVVAELSGIFEDKNETVTLDALTKMTFTEAVIKETLRLFPPIPLVARKCDQDIQVKTGTIPKGSTIMIGLSKIHRDRNQWGENANDFCPERFLAENMHDVHPYSFVSFSKGPRNCVGAKYGMVSMKMYLSYLLRHFKFTTHLSLEDIRHETNISASLANGRPFKLEPRNT